jgi:hypothetical protein
LPVHCHFSSWSDAHAYFACAKYEIFALSFINQEQLTASEPSGSREGELVRFMFFFERDAPGL